MSNAETFAELREMFKFPSSGTSSEIASAKCLTRDELDDLEASTRDESLQMLKSMIRFRMYITPESITSDFIDKYRQHFDRIGSLVSLTQSLETEGYEQTEECYSYINPAVYCCWLLIKYMGFDSPTESPQDSLTQYGDCPHTIVCRAIHMTMNNNRVLMKKYLKSEPPKFPDMEADNKRLASYISGGMKGDPPAYDKKEDEVIRYINKALISNLGIAMEAKIKVDGNNVYVLRNVLGCEYVKYKKRTYVIPKGATFDPSTII